MRSSIIYCISMWIQRLMDTLGNRWFEFSLPPDKAVDFLGVMYGSPSSDPETAKLVLEAFLEDFRSLLWLTYRTDFEPLIDKDGRSTGITSDAGWGCSIRVSQMLMAQSLLYLKHGRNRKTIDLKIASLFQDSIEAPLSIHRMVQAGHSRFGKKPPEWFGPTTGARTIEDLVNRVPNLHGRCVSFDGGEIISSLVTDLFQNECEDGGVIVLLTHRLGLESFNYARYKGTIQSLFSHPFFQGVSSGESIASAYYFFAASDDHLYYLDPHTVQPALLPDSLGTNLIPQPKPLKMRWQRLNPSMTMGFAVRSEIEWRALCDYLIKIDRELFDVVEHRRETPKFTDISDETDQLVLIS
jgi:cysteine protease ATG4